MTSMDMAPCSEEKGEKKSLKDPAVQSTDGLVESDVEAQGCCAPETSAAKAIIKLGICVLAGIVFGWCLEKSRVFEPASIRYQMVFERWIMLKMFLSAVASGQVVMVLLSVLPGTKQRFKDSVDAYAVAIQQKGIIASTLGPFILGIGMTVSGACPGMVLAQVGSWTKNSVYTFIGTLLGAFLYGFVAPHIQSLLKPRKPLESQTIHGKFNIPYIALGLPMAVLLAVVIFLMEWFIPWQKDLDWWNVNSNATATATNPFTLKSWPPSASGAFIGLLQLVIILTVGDTLGGSSAYVTIVSQWVVGKKLQRALPYFACARCGIGNWWQVFYVGAAIIGGALSAVSSNSIGTAQGVDIASAICGGFLLLVGARIGSGCTSGHGLSGMGIMLWMSFLAVPAMFAGAIATAFAMKATGALYAFQCHSTFTDPCHS